MELKATEKLKILLDRDKISYTDIAKKIDKTPQSVAQIFKSDNVSIEKLKEIAAAAGYDLIIDFVKKP